MTPNLSREKTKTYDIGQYLIKDIGIELMLKNRNVRT